MIDSQKFIFKARYYFLRGHSGWMLLFIWFTQFVLIVGLSFPDIPIILIAIVFGSFYIPVCMIVGYWDIHSNFKVEQNLIKEKSPLYAGLFQYLEEIKKQQETDWNLLKLQAKRIDWLIGRIETLEVKQRHELIPDHHKCNNLSCRYCYDPEDK